MIWCDCILNRHAGFDIYLFSDASRSHLIFGPPTNQGPYTGGGTGMFVFTSTNYTLALKTPIDFS